MMTYFFQTLLVSVILIHPVNSYLPLYTGTGLLKGTAKSGNPMIQAINCARRVRGPWLNSRSRFLMTDTKQDTTAIDFMDNLGSVLEQLWNSKPGTEDWSPYSQDLVFQDPLQRTTGLAAYQASLSLLKNSSLFGLPIMQVIPIRQQMPKFNHTLRELLGIQVHDAAIAGADRVRCYRSSCWHRHAIACEHPSSFPHLIRAAGRGGRSRSRSGYFHGGRASCGPAHPTTPSAPLPPATAGCAAGPARTPAHAAHSPALRCSPVTVAHRLGPPGIFGPGPKGGFRGRGRPRRLSVHGAEDVAGVGLRRRGRGRRRCWRRRR
jgi:hypothetical protein